jgi:hypothetical protein
MLQPAGLYLRSFHRLSPKARRLVCAVTVLAQTLLLIGVIHGEMKDFGNRAEGTTVRPNALEDFTLLGVHRSFKQFPRNVDLNVSFFLPNVPGGSPNNVFVQAAEIQDTHHYLMRAKESTTWKAGDWNVFKAWPTKNFIDTLGLEWSNLGVLAGYRIGTKPPVYLPVDVYYADPKPLKLTYTFHYMTGQDLESLNVAVTNSAGADLKLKKEFKCNRSFSPNCKLYAGGSTQAFDLDDMSSKPQGEYIVKLVGYVPGKVTPISMNITFYHHP